MLPFNDITVASDLAKSMNMITSEKHGDVKLWSLSHVYQIFGERAVSAITLGLSRRFRPTSSDAAALIAEWERRDSVCCYPGSVQDLLALKDTLILSVSYKHVPEEEWTRKGQNRICKMSKEDEHLFKAAVLGLGTDPQFPYLMVWCDQVISTRLEDDNSDFKWFHVGLLPYLTFRVLQLSTHIPEELLEKRIWIRAERSLGRRSCGVLSGDDAITGFIGMIGMGQGAGSCIRDMARQILSGYWPEDLGYWANDYQGLKQWALAVLCRGCHHALRVELFQEYDPIDNTEILLNLPRLVRIPWKLEKEEPVLFTSDAAFFLKASAWNLKLESLWNETPHYLSHYMGQLEGSQFSWWRHDSSKLLFGCLANYPRSSATTILALEKYNGYEVFRKMGDLSLYRHAERVASSDTRKLIRECASETGIDIDENLDWTLLYSSDDSGINTRTAGKIMDALERQRREAEVTVFEVYRGITTKLYASAVAVSDGQGDEIAQQICEYADVWSEYVKSTYSEWIAVKDTECGPVWLEGFDANCISFGFPEFLTESLVMRTHRFSSNTCAMSKPEDMLDEMNKMRGNLKPGDQVVAEELFGTVNEGEGGCQITRRDVVRYVLSGGFSRNFDSEGMSRFLLSTAGTRGYWTTNVICRGGKMQMRFFHGLRRRIAQRRTALKDCTGVGLVRPADFDSVSKISEECSTGAYEGMFVYWADMEDTTTRGELLDVFRNSMGTRGGREILLLDMTSECNADEESLMKVCDVEDMFGCVKDTESGEWMRKMRKVGLELAKMDGEMNTRNEQMARLSQRYRETSRLIYERRKRQGMRKDHADIEDGDSEETGE